MENLDITLNAIFNTILERRQSQGAFSHEEYADLVDEVLEEKREVGEIDDDYDFEQAKEALLAKWREIDASDSSESDMTTQDEESP